MTRIASIVRLAAAISLTSAGFAIADKASADCASYEQAVQDALARNDHGALKSAYDNVTACDDAVFRAGLGRAIAGKLFNRLTAERKTSDNLNEILSYGRVWQAEATLGDLSYRAHNYAKAAAQLQDALTTINDKSVTANPPPQDTIGAIFHQAEEANLLASENVPVPRGRGGENEGLGAFTIRGFKPSGVSMPVQFVFGKADFTPQGQIAAQSLVDFIQHAETPPARVKLVGHTDHVGSEEANLVLSRLRAKAVADFLVAHGVKNIPIDTEGVGKSKPYESADRTSLSQDQQDQLDRRVELVH
jgi:outer membrane protein OmpA-like peptidoglycan-associated protein